MPDWRAIGIIPARWASSRFPGKPLAKLWGKPMVQHVWEQASEATSLSEVAIATDDERIAEAADAFGATVVMTRSDHPSGTDRIFEAATKLEDADFVINIQGDEPLLDPKLIDGVVQALASGQAGTHDIVTAASKLGDAKLTHNPNVVKVVPGPGQAWYFSRAAIPHLRDEVGREHAAWWRHIGIYGYRRDALAAFVAAPPGRLEQVESLEQLRALEIGLGIWVVETEDVSPGIDTPEQLAELEDMK